MTIEQYIESINKLYKSGKATEHSYRGDLQQLISSIATEVLVTNEPARIECGAPDYVITRNDIPVGFIDRIIHRRMRESLLESFDKVYIFDLHGNSKKKETHPDGSKDENVFDIMQGVSIKFFVKNGNKK